MVIFGCCCTLIVQELHLEQLRSALEDLREEHGRTERALSRAEDAEREAMDLVEERDENATDADREQVRQASEHVDQCRSQLNLLAAQLEQARLQEQQDATRIARKAQYSVVTAREVMRLFPKERYESMLQNSTDEHELQYLSKFLQLLIRGAENSQESRHRDGSKRIKGDEDSDPEEEEEAHRIGKQKQQTTKITSRRDEYDHCTSIVGLRTLVEFIAVPASTIGDGFQHGIKFDPPLTPEVACEEAAQQLFQKNYSNLFQPAEQQEGESDVVSGTIRSPSDVIKAATVVLATELAMEPSLRLAARKIYLHSATVSTTPTALGIQTITPFSEYFGLQLLFRKPLKEFYQGKDKMLYLRLYEAQQKGLIIVSIDPPVVKDDSGVEHLDAASFAKGIDMANMLRPMLPSDQDPYPHSRLSWDAIRLDVVSMFIQKYLFPSMQVEFHRDLIRVGRDAIIEEASANFEKLLNVGPYRPQHQDTRESIRELLVSAPLRPSYPTVLSVYVPADSRSAEPMYLAFVNKDGILRAHDFVPSLATAGSRTQRIQKLMLEHRPSVVVFNSSGGQAARSLMMTVEKDVLREVVLQIEQEETKRREMSRAYDEEDTFVPYKAEVGLFDVLREYDGFCGCLFSLMAK